MFVQSYKKIEIARSCGKFDQNKTGKWKAFRIDKSAEKEKRKELLETKKNEEVKKLQCQRKELSRSRNILIL